MDLFTGDAVLLTAVCCGGMGAASAVRERGRLAVPLVYTAAAMAGYTLLDGPDPLPLLFQSMAGAGLYLLLPQRLPLRLAQQAPAPPAQPEATPAAAFRAVYDSFFTEGESEESYAICALLHDLCKANYYKLGTRNVKNEATGQWEKAPFYSVDDLFPYGHGEKSVFLIERFMKLKVEEAVAIRWHMGGFDDAARGGCFAISEAYDKYPLAVKLHIADLEATYLMEHRTSAVR